MGDSGLWERYLKLYGKVAAPRSKDFGSRTIYLLARYCKRCGAGMKVPPAHERREAKRLFKVGYCGLRCEDAGPRPERMFTRSLKSIVTGRQGNDAMDDLVDISRELEAKESGSPFLRMIRDVNAAYHLLSEKLSAMELLTREVWKKGKWYFWVRRASA